MQDNPESTTLTHREKGIALMAVALLLESMRRGEAIQIGVLLDASARLSDVGFADSSPLHKCTKDTVLRTLNKLKKALHCVDAEPEKGK